MNLNVSYNWLRELVDLGGMSPGDFGKRASVSGVAVERLYPQAAQFERMVVGVIRGVHPHPNADKLRVVDVDLGATGASVVCGGSNLAEGMRVAVALVGAKVRWHGEGELIELTPAEIRGVKSDGMICASDEIGLKEAFPAASEKEILDLSWLDVPAGTSLAEALDYDDVVMDVEVTTNRPDAFAMAGVAREASAIFGTELLWKPAKLPKGGSGMPLSVKVETPLCSRYMAVALEGVKVGLSPWWMQRRLLMAGLRPINTVVDVTNYVMLELGQPLHAFDARSLPSGDIRVREARKGEMLKVLDGKDTALAPGMVVIAGGERPVAVAGVMGGHDSGVHLGADTAAIVLEAATFDAVSVRRTSRTLNLHTDAALRFEKGLPPELAELALARAVELLVEIADARVASEVVDAYPNPAAQPTFRFRPSKAAELIGLALPEGEMVGSLERLGFAVAGKKGEYEVAVPWWRAGDIEGERDFAEEIARLHGYGNLPSVLPAGELPGTRSDESVVAADDLKRFFAGVGFHEVLTYSFLPEGAFAKFGASAESAYRIANPLTSDFTHMRTSLVPSMLMAVATNQGRFPQGKLFEVSRVYPKVDGVPANVGHVLAVRYGLKDEEVEAAYRELRGVANAWAPVGDVARHDDARDPGRVWHPGRSADLVVGGTVIATVGELHPATCAAFGIDGRVVALLMDRDVAGKLREAPRQFVGTPQFPPVLRDIALMVDEAVAYAEVESAIGAADPVCAVELFDVYRGKGVDAGSKSFALHLTFADPSRTLTAEEVDVRMAAIRASLEAECGATLRS
jgi:phenylalanyl-tRNA synthetase beta chain